MKTQLEKIFTNKKILILGFGREGQSTYQLIRKYFIDKHLSIADYNENIKENSILKNDINIDFIIGSEYLKKLNDFDLIIKSPGISLNKECLNFQREKITSQTDIFLQIFSDKTIGITGTKGKSTTTSLIYHILKLETDNVLLAGNIGIPLFDIIESINEKTKIICELSSHQLEYITKAPHISILLNYFQEHLDHYKSYEDYKLAKFNITLKQNENDYFIFSNDSEEILEFKNKFNLNRNYIPISLDNYINSKVYVKDNYIVYNEEKIYNLSSERNLKGNHNQYNIMASIAACKLLEISDELIKNGIATFEGLPHRMQFIGNINGIDFYNDSIATIPEASIEAVNALKKVNTLIIGGFDRGIDYSKLINFLENKNIEHLIFIDEVGKRVLNELIKNNKCKSEMHLVTTLSEAVLISKQKTKEGKICLLSPAAASYGMFKNFEDRGEQFIRLVRS